MLPPDSAACAYLTRPGETSPMPATGDAYRQSVFADRATGGRAGGCVHGRSRALHPCVAGVGSGGYDTARGRFDGDRLSARALGVEGGPYWVRYRLETGPRYVTRSLRVRVEGPGHAVRALELLPGDDDGRWTVNGRARAECDGALDYCDLGLCPLTNTVPARRRGLHLAREQGPGQQFLMARVAVPELTVTPSAQTYTPLGGHRVRKASGSFRSDVQFDAAGIVVDHPGLASTLPGDGSGS